MEHLNKIELRGTVGSVYVKDFGNSKVTNFSLATNYGYTSQDGTPIIDTTWPQWLPWIGGKHFTFFDPVFNFADSCVTVGAFYLILFQWKFFSSEEKKEK